MAIPKLQQLLERKQKLEKELAKEMDRRLLQIGRLAKNAQLLEWSDDAFKVLFAEAKQRTESDFLPKPAPEETSTNPS